jgi:hypothetical protein
MGCIALSLLDGIYGVHGLEGMLPLVEISMVILGLHQS